MTIKKQTIVLTVLFDKENTYGESAAEAISHNLFNEDGILDWRFQVLKEEEISMEFELAKDDLREETE